MLGLFILASFDLTLKSLPYSWYEDWNNSSMKS